jgi:hypothetical protein
MGREIIERLINYWRKTFFLEPFLILLLIFCLIIGLLHHHKNKERILFTIYFLSGVILFIPTAVIVSFKSLIGKQLMIYQEVGNTFFELTEFLAFYFFFKESLQNHKYQKYFRTAFCILLVSIGIFFIGLTFPTYKAEDIRLHSLVINAIEFFFLFILCLTYFRKLFTDAPTKNLFKRPSFLIVTSTFFYSILMIPFFLIAADLFISEIVIYQTLFACHYILLMILLFSISKAFLCKIPITT